MNLASRKIIGLDHDKIDLFSAVGNQIAVAVNNTKLYQQLEAKIDALKEKKEMIQYFDYSLSHDLKSPATSIYGLTKRLQEKYEATLDQKGRAYCDQILKTSEQMVTLVENINAYIMAKETSLDFEKIKMKEIMETIRNEFSTRLKQRQIKWSEPEVLPEIIANRLALIRVFRNLSDNALKYGGQPPRVELGATAQSDGVVRFWVRDNGPGLPPEAQARLFTPFTRFDQVSTRGHGLGLSIVRRIVEKLGGQAWGESKVGQGSVFSFTLPAIPPGSNMQESGGASEHSQPSSDQT